MFARYGFNIITTAAILLGAVLFGSTIARSYGSVFLPIVDALRSCLLQG